MTKVLIVDDHALVAETLAVALTSDDISVTTVDLEREDPVAVLAADNYDFCLLDLDWGTDIFAGVSLISTVCDSGATCLILTGSLHEPLFGYCLELGAAGVVSKKVSFADLARSVRAAIDGTAPNSDAERYRWLLEAHKARDEHRKALEPFAELTKSEADVLVGLIDGETAADVAASRFVAISTVRTHVRQVLRKLGVNSQLAAVAMAREAGWPRGQSAVDTDSAPHLSSVLPSPRIA